MVEILGDKLSSKKDQTLLEEALKVSYDDLLIFYSRLSKKHFPIVNLSTVVMQI
jgi:hypothetical protein